MISFARFSVQVGVADAQKTKIARDIDSLNAIGTCGVALASRSVAMSPLNCFFAASFSFF